MEGKRERQSELIDRLRRLGVWVEAKEFRDGKIKEFMEGGLYRFRGQAKREAFRLMAERWPPTGEEAESGAVRARRFRRKFPWKGLPATVDPRLEAAWVHANYDLVVVQDPTGRVSIRWDKAAEAAPSRGTRNLMEWAAGNRNGFMRDVWMKFNLTGDDVEEEEKVKKERKRIEEIEAVLDRIEEFEAA